jgi:hypothetical protein
VGALRLQHELVAVGRRLGDVERADHSIRAAHVLDDHLLAEELGVVIFLPRCLQIGRRQAGASP